jgi:hypothetical protein
MPFDKQGCSIGLLSYTEDASQVLLAAKDGVAIDLPAAKEVVLPSWRLTNNGHWFEMLKYGTGDNAYYWHSMTLDIVLERFSGYYMMNDVFYAVLFVAMSWSGFFVNRKHAPARVALSLLPVLTMLNHIRGIQQNLPRSGEVTWLNSFLVASLVYTILAVFEYGLVSYQMGLEDKRAQRLIVLRDLSKHLDLAYAQQSVRLSPSPRSKGRPSDMVSGKIEDVDNIPSAEEAEEGKAPSHAGHPFDHDLDETDLLPMQKRMVEDSMKLFDTQADGQITRKEFRHGLRHFDIYYTAEQVSEIFGKMHVEEDQNMSRSKFLMYLKSMPAPSPTMGQGWLDNPPSAIVDRMFRYGYFVSYVFVIGVMLCVTLAAK